MRRPVMSDSARNMPVDSIITTIITSVIVRIITGSKVGMPKAKGGDHVEPVGLGHLVEVHLAHRRGDHAAAHDAQQHRDVGDESPWRTSTISRMKTSTQRAMAMLSSAP
jgi:hypothetical protein